MHADRKEKNFQGHEDAGLDPDLERGGEPVFIGRTRPPIPHNKYIIKLDGDGPQQVWTGSTNLTPSGFLGQSNVGHLINDSDVAAQYLKYWTILSENPTNAPAKEAIAEISPYPPALVGTNSKTCMFSPRKTASMLNWYADRMSDATSSIMFTAAFKVAEDFIEPLAATATSCASSSRRSRRPRTNARRSGATEIFRFPTVRCSARSWR